VQNRLTGLFLARGPVRTLVTAAGGATWAFAVTARRRPAAWTITPFKGGSAFGGAAATPSTATTAAAEAWTQLVLGQFAILVLVQLLEGGDGALDFLGGNLAVAILVQRSHHREHPHETTGAARPTRTVKLRPAGAPFPAALAGTAAGSFTVALIRAFGTAAGAFPVGPLAALDAFASVAIGPGRTVALTAFLRHRITCHHAETCGSHHQFECQFVHDSGFRVSGKTIRMLSWLQLNKPTGGPA